MLALPAVLALHAVLLALIAVPAGWRADRRVQATEPVRTVLRLITPSPGALTPAKTAPVVVQAMPSAALPAHGIQAAGRSSSSTTPLLEKSVVADMPTAAASALPSTAPAASAPDPGPSLLDTAATRRALHESARTASRDGLIGSRQTAEARMAATLGSDQLTEEDLGDGRRRFRQNGRCVQSSHSRAGQLFPFAPLPTPSLVGDC